MKLGFNFEMDSSNRRDRRIVRDYLNNLARLAPMFGQMVDRLAPGLGAPVGTVHPFPDHLHEVPPPGAPVVSMAEARGRDALRALVGRWREARATGCEFGEAELMGALALHGADVAAYVDGVTAVDGNRLVTAILNVWGPPGVAMSPTEAEEATHGAREAAGFVVSVASALGFTVPASWYSEVCDGE